MGLEFRYGRLVVTASTAQNLSQMYMVTVLDRCSVVYVKFKVICVNNVYLFSLALPGNSYPFRCCIKLLKFMTCHMFSLNFR